MSPTTGVSQSADALIKSFEALFLGQNGIEKKESSTTKSKKHTQSKPTELTVIDVASAFSRARTPEDVIVGIGGKAEAIVLENWKNQLENDLSSEAAKRSTKETTKRTPEKTGFWGNAVNTVTETVSDGWKAVKSWFGFSDEASKAVTATSGISAASNTATKATVATAETTAGTVTNVIGGAFGAYNLIKNFGEMTLESGVLHGAAVGATIGSFFGGPAVGGIIGAIGGGIISLFRKSGKHRDQKMRDQMRDALRQHGVIDQNWSLGLADGSRYNIGLDGGTKKEFGGRRPFEIDLNNTLAVKMAMAANPLTMIVMGGNKKLSSDLSGYISNAALSNANGDEKIAKENMKAIIAQFKVPPEQILQGTVQAVQQGLFRPDEAQVYIEQMREVFK